MAEGYATASTLASTLGCATVAAFDSGNLLPVATALHAKYPEKPVIVAGDDDQHLALAHGINPGRLKAHEAAAAVGGVAIFPVFAPGEQAYLADVARFTAGDFRNGPLSLVQAAAFARMKRFTDFNDLVMNSVLGRRGLERQVRPLIKTMTKMHSTNQRKDILPKIHLHL